jgi:hypothetical protein
MALDTVCPVFANKVNDVIVCVVAIVTVMPSDGFAGIVTVPTAKVPDGFNITPCELAIIV